MKHSPILIAVSLLIGFFSVSPVAQTLIPDTPEQRKERILFLEQDLKAKESPESLRELAMILAVVAGLDDPRQETTQKAESALEKASAANRSDYELMAAHGSVITMLARYETETARQLHLVKKGFRKMDRAIKKDPDNIGALLQRANNSLNMPPFLMRAHYAKRDFQHLLNLTGDSRGAAFKAMILFNLGEACELMGENDEAAAFWEKAIELNVSPWSKHATAKRNS